MTDDLRSLVATAMPLLDSLGIRVDEAAAERTVLSLPWRPELCTAGGVLHGGVLMALADSAGAACAVAVLANSSPAARTSTVESGTHFFAAVRGGVVTATSHPLHTGRSTIVVRTEVRDDTGRLVAETTQTQAVLAG